MTLESMVLGGVWSENRKEMLRCLRLMQIWACENVTDIAVISKGAFSLCGVRLYYRSIIFCSVVYEIVSKVIVDCMKHILHKFIYEPQSTFVLELAISDNTIIDSWVVAFITSSVVWEGWLTVFSGVLVNILWGGWVSHYALDHI